MGMGMLLKRALGARGSVMVKALCYKPECRCFDSRCDFLNELILPAAPGPVIYSASNRNEY
jgi:hypothetical protein